MSTDKNLKKRGTKTRKFNAFLAAIVLCFFIIHIFAGTAFIYGYLQVDSWVPYVIWTFFGLIIIHVITCIFTSYFMLIDKVNAPSKKKKNHLLLKWITGVFLLLCALSHGLGQIFLPQFFSDLSTVFLIDTIQCAILITFLAWHACVGVKSLLKDLNLPYSEKIKIIICAVLIIIIAILGAIMVAHEFLY
ncbi:MAG: hypothetical protein MJ189_00905 [Coriobacteriales bacterium]|nr:hypothetical protein [Coriobacteriales bacterium]